MTTMTVGGVKLDKDSEIKLIKQRLTSTDDLERFNKLMRHCANDTKETERLLVSYRHLLPELYDQQLHGVQVHPVLKRPIIIGYLINEDIVFFNDLDDVICNYLRNEGECGSRPPPVDTF
jgi:hypothetical protein